MGTLNAKEIAAAVERLKAQYERQRQKLETCNAENGELRLEVKQLAKVKAELKATKDKLAGATEAARASKTAELKARSELASAQSEIGGLRERLDAFEGEAAARERVSALVEAAR